MNLGGGSGVRPLKCHGSADLVTGAKADGMIVLPRNLREVPASEHVEFRPWRRL